MESLLFGEKLSNHPRYKILYSALHLFTENGYKETSVLDVVARAHVSKTTFYNFFNSKEELLAELFQSLLEEVLQEVRLSAEADRHLADKAFAGIRRYLEICYNRRSVARLLLVTSVGASTAVEEVRQLAHVQFAELIYETLQSELVVTESVSHDELHTAAQAMVGAINEVVIQKIIVPDEKDDVERLSGLLNRIVMGTFSFLVDERNLAAFQKKNVILANERK